jgi:uncharacterized membrane protein YkvA (DUF1232 family)
MQQSFVVTLRIQAKRLKRELIALYGAGRDARTPWYAKLIVGIVLAYALSPIDLIPDFIPVLGYLDDLILVPAGIKLAIRLIPEEVLAEHRARAGEGVRLPHSRTAAAVIVLLWLLILVLAIRWMVR